MSEGAITGLVLAAIVIVVSIMSDCSQRSECVTHHTPEACAEIFEDDGVLP